MAKTQKILSLVLLIVCIYLVFVLKSRYDEGFYSGTINNKFLYPLAYQMPGTGTIPSGPNQSRQIYQGLKNMNVGQTRQGPVYYYGPEGTASNSDDPNSNLFQQPLMYPTQMYPKIPWAPKTGMSCVEGQCGATGSCVDGVCQQNPVTQTVFGIDV